MYDGMKEDIRSVFEFLYGIVLGLPLGLMLYFVPMELMADVYESLGTMSNPVIQFIFRWFYFTPLVVLLLFLLAVLAEYILWRRVLSKKPLVTAWTAVYVSFLVALPFYIATLAQHKPVLPMYG